MTNTEALLALVTALPEIELQQLLEGVAEHCSREKLHNVVKSAFREEDVVTHDEYDELERQCEDLKDENQELEVEVSSLEDQIEKLKEELEEAKA